MKRFFVTTCTAALLGLSAPVAFAETPADTLVIVREISSISDWDPQVSQILDVQEINLDVYDRLVGFDRRTGGPAIPMLAESYTVSEDGSTITFKMRPGVKFHSGNPVTAFCELASTDKLETGVWSCSQGGWTIESFSVNEVMVLLAGRLRLTASDGTVTELSKGDMFFLPKGWSGRWDTLEDMQKAYVIVY